MDDQQTLVYCSQIPLRWGDEDSLNHINNTLYFRYMEQARVEWLDSLGLAVRMDKREGAMVAEASCRFLVPLTYPGVVECRVFTAPPGRTSLTTFYELCRVGDERLYASGMTRIVWVDRASGKPVPLPDQLRQWLNEKKQ
jgi:acyl-CoA thioester hydrolase